MAHSHLCERSFLGVAPPFFQGNDQGRGENAWRQVGRLECVHGLAELGKGGIAFTGTGYQNQTEYIFTGLNDIKPAMIQQATRVAREVALKFAQDSDSRLGKIRKASQGQFSINPRDKNNPHIKKIRVVSTVEYYLSD